MVRSRGMCAFVLLTMVGGVSAAQGSQSCVISQAAAGEADKAMAAEDFARAHQLYETAWKTHPEDMASFGGLVRAELGEGQMGAALTLVRGAMEAHPTDAQVREAMGEVAMRRGEPEEAAKAFDAAMKLDPCLPQLHLDFARYLNLVAMHASARRQIELAHKLGDVTGVYGSDMADLRGLSGKVNKTAEASSVNFQFAGVQQRVNGMLAIDTEAISRDLGVEIGGFLAFPTLSELVISLDYRDDLMEVIYDPGKGYHQH